MEKDKHYPLEKIQRNLYYELLNDNHCFYDAKYKQGIMVCFNSKPYSKEMAIDMAKERINKLRDEG